MNKSLPMGTGNPNRFRVWFKGDFDKLPANRWRVQGIVIQGITVLYGESKFAKKSFVAISIAYAVAAGKDWCGFPTLQTKVLYVCGEDFNGILRRQEALEKLRGPLAKGQLGLLKIPINFFDKKQVNEAIDALKAQGFKPGLVIIDTLARSMVGGKESTTEDMSEVFELIETFRREFNGADILVVHHTTKDGLNYRGSSVIYGSVDGMMSTHAKDMEITVTSDLFKNAPAFDTFTVCCESVEIETEDGPEMVLAVKDRATTDNTSVTSAGPNQTDRHAEQLTQIVAQSPWIRSKDLQAKSGLPETTFLRAIKRAKDNNLLIGGGKGGYNLAPINSASPSPPPVTATATLIREWRRNGGEGTTTAEEEWRENGGGGNIESCKNVDTTASVKNSNEIKEGERPDLVSDALKQIAAKKKPTAA